MKQRLNPLTAAPEGVAALVNVENYLQKSGLDHKLMALVKTRVSQINGCAYCLHMHTKEARELGESDQRLILLDAWYELNLYTPRERAALAWAESLTNIATTHAPDDAYDEARKQFPEKDLANLSIAIAMINAWNRLAIGSRSIHPADLAKAALTSPHPEEDLHRRADGDELEIDFARFASRARPPPARYAFARVTGSGVR